MSAFLIDKHVSSGDYHNRYVDESTKHNTSIIGSVRLIGSYTYVRIIKYD